MIFWAITHGFLLFIGWMALFNPWNFSKHYRNEAARIESSLKYMQDDVPLTLDTHVDVVKCVKSYILFFNQSQHP